MTWELRLGRWQEALIDVECDTLIVDAPYSARTHEKQTHGRRPEQYGAHYVTARGLGYSSLSPEDVAAFVAHWAPRTRGWFCTLTDSELYPAWRDALRAHGRYVFAPLPCLMPGMNVRLAGDGPSSWTCWLIVARPKELRTWGTLPGGYYGNPFDAGENHSTAFRRSSVIGGKPLWLMRAIVRDYSEPGGLICDPCAGGATTLLAAFAERRSAIGCEVDPYTHSIAMRRLEERAGALPLLASIAAANDNGGPPDGAA